MRAGELRHRITIQKPTSTRNAAGEVAAGWTSGFQTQAAIRPASSREVMLNQNVAAQVTHTITLRYLSGERRVLPTMRVILGDPSFSGRRVFQIAGVINVDERNVELRLVCYETAGDA